MNSKVYKWCAVPLCKNTSISTPKKLFVYVPNVKSVRNKWLKLARRNPSDVVTNSSIYFCEDHFDLPNDMENYMQYHVMGSVSQVRMKPGCIPKKFACQPDRKTRTSDTPERPYIRKKRKRMILEECEKQLEQSSMVAENLNVEDTDTASESSEKSGDNTFPMETNTTYLGDVLIKEEHAYACQENSNPNSFAYETLEDDPLRLSPDRVEIKTEIEESENTINEEAQNKIVEEPHIKIEEGPEIKMEVDTVLYTNITDIPENIPTIVAINSGLQDYEVVPKTDFLELQRKYEIQQIVVRQKDKLFKENIKLRTENTKLKAQTQRDANNYYKFNRETMDLKTTIRSLENEIKKLKSENEAFQNKQTDIFAENYQFLEKTVDDLKSKVKMFLAFQKNSTEQVKVLKMQLAGRETINRDVKIKLHASINKLEKMNYKIRELTKYKKKYHDILKHNTQLADRLEECNRSKQSYKNQFEILKKELEIKLDEKNRELGQRKNEIANMATNLAENESTVNLLRNKYKELFKVADQSKEIISSLKTNVCNKVLEIKNLSEKIVSLEADLQKSLKRTCEYCGL